MHLLLIHQNFPAQFRELGPAWLAAGHRITAIGCRPEPPHGAAWQGLRYWSYRANDDRPPDALSPQERADAIAQLCGHLIEQGLNPDLVMAHSAWGEALPLRRLFPATPLVIYPELWGCPSTLGVGFDQHLPPRPDAPALEPLRRRIQQQNLLADLAISQADAVVVPSRSQWASFPAALRPRLQAIVEGVNLARLEPPAGPPAALAPLPAGAPLITLVSRELEPLRGLRQALLAWPRVAREHPSAQLVLVGDSSGGYGEESPRGASHLDDALAALPGDIDRGRIHALGRLDHDALLHLFHHSSGHLGLSYPYTLSWSLLEAMACGAPVVTNHGSPLAAEVQHDVEALLVPFNDADALAEALLQLLGSEELRRRLGQAGQQRVRDRFSLQQGLQGYGQLFDQLQARRPGPGPTPATAPANRRGGAGATAAGLDTSH